MIAWLLFACAMRQAPTAGLELAAWTEEDPAEVQLAVVDALVDSESWDPALKAINELRSQGLDDPRLDVLQARALLGKARPKEALAVLDKVPRSNDPEYWRVRSLAYMDLGDVDAALECARKALRLGRGEDEPYQAKLQNNLGFCLASSGRWEEAESAYRAALTLDPTFDRARNNLAFALAAQDRDEEAYDAFYDATEVYGLAEDQRQSMAWMNLGVAQEARGDTAEAVFSYQKALELAPDNTRAAEYLNRLQERPT